MFTLAALVLLGALIDGDFRLTYVARFTERALPTGYKLAAFWAGQEGSLLLWGWLIAAMAVRYHGTIPDLFKAGADVVVEGKMNAAGTFEADVLLTKCASKYDAKHAAAGTEKRS